MVLLYCIAYSYTIQFNASCRLAYIRHLLMKSRNSWSLDFTALASSLAAGFRCFPLLFVIHRGLPFVSARKSQYPRTWFINCSVCLLNKRNPSKLLNHYSTWTPPLSSSLR